MLLAISLAFADIAPEPGFVETCTESVCGPGEEATTCSGSFQGRPECEAREKEGWSKKCQTRGASVWSEVLCRPAKGGSGGGLPAAPAKSGCGGGAAGGLALFASLAFWTRRRGQRADRSA